MKPTLRNLKRGQQVWALVEESIAHNELVINFGGDLVRVQNQTDKALRAGQRVLVKISNLHPLQLQLVPTQIKDEIFPRTLDLQV